MRLLGWRRDKRGRRRSPPPRPALRQPALLRLPDGEQLDALVVGVGEHEVVLALLLEATDPVRPGDVVEMELEFGGPRGLVTVRGRGAVEEEDLVRFELGDEIEIQQRRDFVRVRVVRPLALAPIDEDGRVGAWINTLTVNISGNGLLASGPDTLEPDTEVRFRLRLREGETPIHGTGVVARASDEGHRGIRYVELDEPDRRRLIAFIFERERIARRMTRDREL